MSNTLPEKYIQAEEWAKLFLKRMDKLKKRYNDDEDFRRYLNIVGGKETASLKRTSMELTHALVEMRKPS
ncbi:hypothetical protein BH23PAT2_BH23PAT2_08310 [soil metagenome]